MKAVAALLILSIILCTGKSLPTSEENEFKRLAPRNVIDHIQNVFCNMRCSWRCYPQGYWTGYCDRNGTCVCAGLRNPGENNPSTTGVPQLNTTTEAISTTNRRNGPITFPA